MRSLQAIALSLLISGGAARTDETPLVPVPLDQPATDTTPIPAPRLKLEPTAKQLTSCVALFGRQSGGTLQATGFIVDAERRWVLTAWHFWSEIQEPGVLSPSWTRDKCEVAPSIYLNLYFKGKSAKSRLVWYDSAQDLALVEVPELVNPAAVTFGKLTGEINEPIAALGNPTTRNAMWQVERGQVTNHQYREWTYTSGQRIAAAVFEASMEEPLSTGFSGGPVFNTRGEVVGLVIATAKPDGSAIYAVGSETMRRFIARAHGELALKKLADGDTKAAKQHANQAIGWDAGDPWVLFVRGKVLRGQGRNSEAQDDFQRAVRLVPSIRSFTLWCK